jgi:hypothetical protein
MSEEQYDDYGNPIPPPNPDMVEWARDNESWFNKDPVLTAAAIELDTDMQLRGVPPTRARFNQVEDRLRESFPERFFDHSERKLKWSDIADPIERREAKRAFSRMQDEFSSRGKKVTEEQYLKDYMK